MIQQFPRSYQLQASVSLLSSRCRLPMLRQLPRSSMAVWQPLYKHTGSTPPTHLALSLTGVECKVVASKALLKRRSSVPSSPVTMAAVQVQRALQHHVKFYRQLRRDLLAAHQHPAHLVEFQMLYFSIRILPSRTCPAFLSDRRCSHPATCKFQLALWSLHLAH